MMYVRNSRRVQRRPLPMGGFWGDLFAKKPQVVVSPEQRAIMSRWPVTAQTYQIGKLLPFLQGLAVEASRVLGKTADVTAQRSIGPFGPSDELLDKISDIETEIGKLAVRVAKMIQFTKAKGSEGYTAVEFPNLRADAFSLMSLTRSLDFLVELEGGPSWIGTSLLNVVDAFSRSGAWLIKTGAKIAKPLLALLSSADLVIVGGLGLLGLWWWKRRQR